MKIRRRALSVASVIVIVAAFCCPQIPVAFAQEGDGAPVEPPAEFVGAWPIAQPQGVLPPSVEAPPTAPVPARATGLSFDKPDPLAGASPAHAWPVVDTHDSDDAASNDAPWEPSHPLVSPVSGASVAIVGGTISQRGEIPWQAQLLIKGRFACGAILIHPRWVLTAAHCVSYPPYYAPPSWFTIVLGEYDVLEYEGVEQARAVSQVIAHPQFSFSTIDYDVALLELSMPVEVGIAAEPISLVRLPNDAEAVEPGDEATVSGWGDTEYFGYNSDILRKVVLPIVADGLCTNSYLPYLPITPRMICAGVPMGGRAPCQGDSGGPLVVTSASGTRKVAGIVSFGVACDAPGFPAVFTRVSALVDWIEGYVGAAGASGAIQNPGFEDGPGGQWYEHSAYYDTSILKTDQLPIEPYAGDYAAWLGSEEQEHAYLYTPVLSGRRAKEVSFAYYVASEETSCEADTAKAFVAEFGSVYDRPAITILRSEEILLCGANVEEAWRRLTISLDGLQGMSQIYVGVEVSTDFQNKSSLLVDDFQLTDEPLLPLTIDSFAPITGTIGSRVTITGTGFLDTSQVLFGDRHAIYVVASDERLTAYAPAAVATAPIRITTAYTETTSAVDFTALPTTQFKYHAILPWSGRR